MVLHQVLDEEKVSHRRDDRDKKNPMTDSPWSSRRLTRARARSRSRAASAFPNSKMTPLREIGTMVRTFSRVTRLSFSPKKKIELFQLAFDRASVAAGQQDKKIERLLVETQLALFA